MSRAKDIRGQNFGRLSVIERARSSESGRARWRCRCICGNEIITDAYSLRSGATRSCGCLQKEVAAATSRKYIRTHNQKNSRLYNIWSGIKGRTGNPAHQRYSDYGGRGIAVCPEWRNSFETFRDWSLSNGYRDDLSIDRKDNDGPYSPENCHWISRLDQANNKRNNRLIEFNGEIHTLAEWAKITGINYYTLKTRFSRGWDPQKALLPPTAIKKM